VPESDQRSAVSALEMDPIDAKIRQVFFSDTPDLTLYRHGVVVRARRAQGNAHDTVVKLRPVDPTVIRHTIMRHAPPRKLFSKEQRKFYDARPRRVSDSTT
jgi:hypothetical protein